MSTSKPQAPTSPFTLTMPFFPLNVDLSMMLQGLERHAERVVKGVVDGFDEPGIKLVGTDGKPLQSVVDQLHTKLIEYMLELIALPTLDEEWVAAPTPAAKAASIAGYSFRVAYLVYQDFARVLNLRGAAGIRERPDAILTQGLNALHHELDPLDAYIQGIPTPVETSQGVLLLGQEVAFKECLRNARNALFLWLSVKGLMLKPLQKSDLPILTPEAVRLLKHLLAVVGYVESTQAQLGALLEEARVILAQDPTKTTTQIRADLHEVERQLQDPNAHLPEA